MSKKKQTEKKVALPKESFISRYAYILIFSLGLLVYAQTLTFDYVYLDDDLIILDNHDMISSLANIPAAFTTQYGFNQGTPYYRPIVNLSFILDAQLGGRDPFIYHLDNLLLNILGACLLYFLLRKMKLANNSALFLSLVFVIHPVLTNSVAWIVGRNDLLAGIFTFLSFIWFIKYIEDHKVKSLVIHSVTYLAAIFSKEVALALPFAAIGYIYILKLERPPRIVWAWVIPVVIFQGLKHIYIEPAKNVTYGIPALIENIRALPEGIFKIIIPVNLAVLPTFNDVQTVAGTVLLILFFTLPLLLKTLDKRKYYFGLIWFLIFVLPGLFILYSDQSEKFQYLDTRLYIPLVGILISIGELFRAFRFDLIRKKEIYTGSAIILLMAVLTVFQSVKYLNAITFAQSAIQSNPERAFFYQKLADYYFTKADYDNAIIFLKKTIEKSPGNYLHYKNLALSYYNKNELSNAKVYLEKADNSNPRDFEVIQALIKINYLLHNYKASLVYADRLLGLGATIDQELYNDLKKLADQ